MKALLMASTMVTLMGLMRALLTDLLMGTLKALMKAP
jgi:hypothetical protein